MKKSLILCVLIILLCPMVLADGMVHIYDSDMWRMQNEKQQLAAINYENGYENMLITIDIDNQVQGQKAVWLFPIPAQPDKVVIDVVKGFPRLYGKDVNSAYKSSVSTAGWVMAGYSTFPVNMILLWPGLFLFSRMGATSIGGLYEDSASSGVIIHETVQKLGVTTELITAKDPAEFNNYLNTKGLYFDENSMNIIKDYVGKNYSFVVSYIPDVQAFKQQATTSGGYNSYGSSLPIGVFVKFPTDKIFFPLKPTSVYGSSEIPLVVYVLGHVTPELYGEIKPLTTVTYYVQDYFSPTLNDAQLFNQMPRSKSLEYTKIKMTVPSKYFVDDLWIDQGAPAIVGIESFLAKAAWFWGILFYVILSVLASWLAGILIYKKEYPEEKWIIHGMWNCLTAIGFVLATIFMKTKEIDQQLLQEARAKGLDITVRDNRKWGYGFLFYLFFLLGAAIISVILMYVI